MKLARSDRQMSQFGSNQCVLIRVTLILWLQFGNMSSAGDKSARFLHFSGGVLPLSSYVRSVLFKLTEFDEFFEEFQQKLSFSR